MKGLVLIVTAVFVFSFFLTGIMETAGSAPMPTNDKNTTMPTASGAGSAANDIASKNAWENFSSATITSTGSSTQTNTETGVSDEIWDLLNEVDHAALEDAVTMGDPADEGLDTEEVPDLSLGTIDIGDAVNMSETDDSMIAPPGSDGWWEGSPEDIDGDGILNGEDKNMDGDDKFNSRDPDMDGDGVLNVNDLDLDGDGLLNSQDPDVDGDGILNEDDGDIDGDDNNNRYDSSPSGAIRDLRVQ